MAAKLHELLAVESALENQSDKTRSDLMATFEKKRHLFSEKRIVFNPSGEGAAPAVEEQSDIQTNVEQELAWLAPHIVKSWDASLQVAHANTTAVADIVLEDQDAPLATNIPATALLELEKRVAQIHAFINTIPTLDPAKGFKQDPQRAAGIYQARDVNKARTKKDKRAIVLYNATEHHPAQTQLIDEDKPIGTIQEQEWSGLITPIRKAEMLDRVERLSRAVRRARARANEVEIDQTKKIGAQLITFVFGVAPAIKAAAK